MNVENDSEFEELEDDDLEGEFEISIEPRDEALEAAGISADEFETALMEALEQREEFAVSTGTDEDSFPELEETQLTIRGKAFRLGDLAMIEVSPVSDDDEEFDDDEEEEEDEEAR